MDMESLNCEAFMILVIFSSTFIPLIELHPEVQSSIITNRLKRRNHLENMMDFRIVGGEDASVKDYPFIVSLQERSFHICGGSILTELFILSAAHCVVSIDNNDTWIINDPLEYNIVAGQTILDVGECQYRDVKQLYVHQHYNVTVQRNDIALIQIFIPLEWTNYTKPVDIFSAIHPPYESHDFCIVFGWGSREEYLELPENEAPPQINSLQQVDLPPSSIETCSKYFLLSRAPELFDETKLCVILTGGKDACRGDSGGPFICDGIQYGIVSFGIGCAYPNMPALFTNVSAFHDWIYGVMNNTERSVVSRMLEVINRYRPIQSDVKMKRSRSINAQLNLKCYISRKNLIIFYALLFWLECDVHNIC